MAMVGRTALCAAAALAAGLLATDPAPAQEAAADRGCAAVRRFPDRLICADAALRAADAAMGEAYAALRARLDATGRGRLLAAQRRWLALRARACAGFNDQEDRIRARCLTGLSEARRAALAAGRIEGEIVVGPQGTPADAPPLAIVTEALHDPRRHCTVVLRRPHLDAAGPTAQATARAFNAAIEATVADPLFVHYGSGFAHWRGCPGPRHDFPAYDFVLDFSVTMRTARFIAVTFVLYYDSGNAHPLAIERAVTFDMARGRALGVADMVQARGLPAVVAACRRALEEENGVAVADDVVAMLVEGAGNWSVGPAGVRIIVPPWTALPGPPRGTDCTIPRADLADDAVADGPLAP